MVAPLFGEQLLVMLVGLFDTLVISYAGEEAVSGVSLVNQFNTIFIYLFTALASGGAVVVSQYIGRKEMDRAGESASQLLFFSTLFSVVIGMVVLAGNKAMLSLLFGSVEDSVMAACITLAIVDIWCWHHVIKADKENDIMAICSNKRIAIFLWKNGNLCSNI